MRRKLCWVVSLLSAAPAAAAGAQTLDGGVYQDRLKGLWLGEIAGNYAGRPVEGTVQRGGISYTVNWTGGSTADGDTPDDGVFTRDVWSGDDDTVFEYMYGNLLSGNAAPTNADLRSTWVNQVDSGIYIANLQSYFLIHKGVEPPTTGSARRNVLWDMIDSQITTEALGALLPGTPRRAAELAGTFAHVTNDGFAVHAAQYYAAMYSIGAGLNGQATPAALESLVQQAQTVVPTTSRTHLIIQDVRDLYAQDKQDGQLDWQAAQRALYDRYAGAQSMGRYRGIWTESSINTAMTTLALLYGQGNYRQTVEIGVLAGFDDDCNPATAGGLLGVIKGYAQLRGEMIAEFGVTPPDGYHAGGLKNLPLDVTIDGVASVLRQAGQAQIVRAGGNVQAGGGGGTTYVLPADSSTPLLEKPDPTGPAGLVGAVRAAGGTATVTASRAAYSNTDDRAQLNGVIDGITDVSYNGHMAYESLTAGAAPADGIDWYDVAFDREVRFDSLLLVEGNIDLNNINADPANVEPRGGYFTDLQVLVRQNGVYIPVTSLSLSEPLDPLAVYQQIQLTFDPIFGDAIQLIGHAGGTEKYTSILELQPGGLIPEPAAGMLLIAATATIGMLARRRRR
jgi:hypothetical protein